LQVYHSANLVGSGDLIVSDIVKVKISNCGAETASLTFNVTLTNVVCIGG
jgi:hypothetical protein